MAYPRKSISVNNIPPILPLKNYSSYEMKRIEELMLITNEKTKNLPKTILFEDLDLTFYEYVNNGNLLLVIDGKKVPVFYLENERWGELQKTWKFMDDDKNIPTPYITVRRSDVQDGTRMDGKYNVAQNKLFKYLDVPILDDGQVINLRYKMPQPTNVDFLYEVALFTKYREDVNTYDELLFKKYASLQDYVWVKGYPMPLKRESRSEPKNVLNVDGDKIYVTIYTIRLQGFIQDEKDFQIIKTFRKPNIGLSL